MTELTIKPTALQAGMPKQHRNGFFGIEQKLLGMAIDQEVVVVAVFKVAEKTTQEGAGVQYPSIGIVHLEPLWDDIEADDALKILRATHKERTGKDQLDIPEEKPASKKKAEVKA